jgi:hypothetical protein
VPFDAIIAANAETLLTRTPCDVEALAAGSDGACRAGAPWDRRAGAVAGSPPPARLPRLGQI